MLLAWLGRHDAVIYSPATAWFLRHPELLSARLVVQALGKFGQAIDAFLLRRLGTGPNGY